jgi:hypothetical protein
LQHFLQIILTGSVEKASDQGGGVGEPAGDVEGRGVGEDSGDGAGGGDAEAGGEGGIFVGVDGVFGAVMLYSPVKDREELSRALSEQVRELQDTWRVSMTSISSMSPSCRSSTSHRRLVAFLGRLAGGEVAADGGGDGATGKGCLSGRCKVWLWYVSTSSCVGLGTSPAAAVVAPTGWSSGIRGQGDDPEEDGNLLAACLVFIVNRACNPKSTQSL